MNEKNDLSHKCQCMEQMIKSAIIGLNSIVGSTLANIKDFISNHFNVIFKPDNFEDKLLKMCIKTFLENGTLIKTSGSGLRGKFTISNKDIKNVNEKASFSSADICKNKVEAKQKTELKIKKQNQMEKKMEDKASQTTIKGVRRIVKIAIVKPCIFRLPL